MPQKSIEADTGTGVLTGWESGDGPPLLLLHGGPGLSDYMSMLGPETVGWRCIGYQQRGVAPSATERPFTVVRQRRRRGGGALADQEGIEQLALLWPAYFAVPAQAPPPPAGLTVSVAGNEECMASVADAGHLPWHERPGCVAGALATIRDRTVM